MPLNSSSGDAQPCSGTAVIFQDLGFRPGAGRGAQWLGPAVGEEGEGEVNRPLQLVFLRCI